MTRHASSGRLQFLESWLQKIFSAGKDRPREEGTAVRSALFKPPGPKALKSDDNKQMDKTSAQKRSQNTKITNSNFERRSSKVSNFIPARSLSPPSHDLTDLFNPALHTQKRRRNPLREPNHGEFTRMTNLPFTLQRSFCVTM
jgi:hypothetical protein